MFKEFDHRFMYIDVLVPKDHIFLLLPYEGNTENCYSTLRMKIIYGLQTR